MIFCLCSCAMLVSDWTNTERKDRKWTQNRQTGGNTYIFTHSHKLFYVWITLCTFPEINRPVKRLTHSFCLICDTLGFSLTIFMHWVFRNHTFKSWSPPLRSCSVLISGVVWVAILSHKWDVVLFSRCLEFLLQSGATASLKDKQGYNPVHYAAAYGHRHCLELVSLHTHTHTRHMLRSVISRGHVEEAVILLHSDSRRFLHLLPDHIFTAHHATTFQVSGVSWFIVGPWLKFFKAKLPKASSKIHVN